MARKKSPPEPKEGRAIKEKDATPAAALDPVQVWQGRITRENKVYDAWAKEYDVERGLHYYLGKQWKGLARSDADKKYVINLIFATIETQMPSLLFSRPKVTVEPRPSDVSEQPKSDAGGRASLIESTLQTFIDDPRLKFNAQTALSLKDGYFRFSVIEVGYTADWIDNPNADKPALKDDGTDMLDSAGQPVKQPRKLLKKGSEELFIKRIPPQSFRASPGHNILEENDWIAYYEWHPIEDIQANPEYENTTDLKPTGQVTNQPDQQPEQEQTRERQNGMVKLWKIWDLRKKVRHVIAEGHPKMLQQDKPWTAFPLAALKFYEIPDAWYPLPPVFNWIKPQDEINESREMQRTHRRRFVRRYMREPNVKQEEFDKLEAGEDGVCIEVPKVNPSPIMPIPDAELGQSNWEQLASTKDDFQQITGVSGEARGIPEADTATQANIINVRSQIRESSARLLVADWLATIARLMLLTIREHMQLPMVVKLNTDPFAPKKNLQPLPQPGVASDPVGALIQAGPSRGDRIAQEWKQVESKDLDLDVDVKIDIASLSPVAEDAQRAQWNIVLQLLTNPPLFQLLMTPNPDQPDDPPPLLRKTLVLNGVKSDQEIREIYRVGRAVLASLAQAASAQKPDVPSISYAFKGEDLGNPIVLAAFVRAEGLQSLVASVAPGPGAVGDGGSPGLPGLPAAPGAGGNGGGTGAGGNGGGTGAPSGIPAPGPSGG